VAAFLNFLKFFLIKKRNETADFLVFGIGNPGARYGNTRHNAGFMVAGRVAESLSGVRRTNVSSYDAWVGALDGKTVAVVKPKTFVNRCGTALAESRKRFNVPLASILVVADDYHLQLGLLRLRRGGSDGGHNGLASIIEQWGPDFPRLRVGIGPQPGGVRSVEFVLGEFTGVERPALDAAVEKAARAVTVFITEGADAAMNRYNRSGQ
jgi:peptidyl-tRNA hydrolase, PTH1 family